MLPAGSPPRDPVVRSPSFRGANAGAVFVAGVLFAAASVALALSSSTTGDYLARGAVAGDNAGPAITALSHGDLPGFVQRQPFMGLTSLLLRAPFVAMASIWRGGNALQYALGALACVVPAALLVSWMFLARGGRGSWFPPAIAALILLVSPVAVDAIAAGHPEETLASALAACAVVMALGGRTTWAALALGLAVGTKEWAMIAAVPVLIALRPSVRVRAAAVATATGLALCVAAPLADLGAFTHASAAVGASHTANVASVWWPLSSALRLPGGSTGVPTARLLPFGLTRSAALIAVMAFVLVAAAATFVLVSRKRGTQPRVDGLALLALLGLARCIADPGDLHYYLLAAIVPLTAWEVLSLRRVPITAVIAVGAAELTFNPPIHFAPALLNGLALVWMVCMSCYLARRVFWTRAAFRERPLVEIRAQAHAASLR